MRMKGNLREVECGKDITGLEIQGEVFHFHEWILNVKYPDGPYAIVENRDGYVFLVDFEELRFLCPGEKPEPRTLRDKIKDLVIEKEAEKKNDSRRV